MPETPCVKCLTRVLAVELEALWGDLDRAKQRAYNGDWSIECDSLSWRIEQITRLVGPCPWGAIQMPLLLDGTYERLHAEWGIPHDPFDREGVQAMWDRHVERNRATLERLRG